MAYSLCQKLGKVGREQSSQRQTVAGENCPQVDGTAYMPGVYKISMVRMPKSADEPAKVRVYTVQHRNVPEASVVE